MSGDYDALVVGAGPAGLTAAKLLAVAGWRVGVLEEHSQVGSPVNCSGVISVEAVRRFEIPDRLIRHTLQTVQFQSPRGQWLSFDAGRPIAHAVERAELDKLLGSRAIDAGAELLLEHRAMDMVPISGGMAVEVRVKGDGPIPLRTRSVVLATGAGVPLLKKLGWDACPQRLLGVQTELSLEAGNVEVYLGRRWAPEGFAWIIPVAHGRAKAGLMCHRDGPQYLMRFLDRPDVLSRLQSEPGPFLTSVLPLGFLPRSYSDRVLVVGEAAGHIKATTCGGIYYSMLTAGLAAEVLDEALKHDRLEAHRLSLYEERWRDLLEDEIQVGLVLRRTFRLLGDLSLDKLLSLAGRDGILNLIHEKMNFDWHRDLIRAVLHHAAVKHIVASD